MKYVQTHFLKENLCELQVFLCALISRPVCARAQLRGNIGYNSATVCDLTVPVPSLVKGGW